MGIDKYKFLRQDVLILRALVKEEKSSISLKSNLWYFENAGNSHRINWNEFEGHPCLHIFKGFLADRLRRRSKRNAILDIRMLNCLNKDFVNPTVGNNVPDKINILIKSDTNIYYCYKAFCIWVLKNFTDINSMRKQLEELELNKPQRKSSYNNISTQNYELTPDVINKLLVKQFSILNSDSADYSSITKSLIVLTAYELGLRAIQIHALDKTDLIKNSNNTDKYFALRIQNVKKKSSNDVHFSSKAISRKLGEFLENYVNRYAIDPYPMFCNNAENRRLKSYEISKIINSSLREVGVDTKEFPGNSILRHNLAQVLANQGSPAEIIASVLGHNSTVASKAYVDAVPSIAQIKTRALGHSRRFIEIIDLLMTGEPKEKGEVEKEKWVHGVVGKGFIGGIGGCGLSSNVPCPKNPVYSCYTCQKFHPFKEGPHQEVLDNLREEVQLFIDQANHSGDFLFNRSIDQLELTIESVVRTIERFNL